MDYDKVCLRVMLGWVGLPHVFTVMTKWIGTSDSKAYRENKCCRSKAQLVEETLQAAKDAADTYRANPAWSGFRILVAADTDTAQRFLTSPDHNPPGDLPDGTQWVGPTGDEQAEGRILFLEKATGGIVRWSESAILKVLTPEEREERDAELRDDDDDDDDQEDTEERQEGASSDDDDTEEAGAENLPESAPVKAGRGRQKVAA